MYRDTTNVEHGMYDYTSSNGVTGIVTKGLKKNLEAIPGKHSLDSL
jgi:hypothetical protein